MFHSDEEQKEFRHAKDVGTFFCVASGDKGKSLSDTKQLSEGAL